MGPPKMDGSWWRGLTECGPLEKGMASHLSVLALDKLDKAVVHVISWLVVCDYGFSLSAL